MTTRRLLLGASLLFAWLVQGCGGIPRDALQMKGPTVAQRRLQTRVFETADESRVLSACASLLQDLGFTIDKSETAVGLIVASKDRSAADAGQVAGAFVKAALFGVHYFTYDKKQKIRASLVTHPLYGGARRVAVRVTFQRIVWDNYDRITKRQSLNQVELYTGFFDGLSKAVFLEAHEI